MTSLVRKPSYLFSAGIRILGLLVSLFCCSVYGQGQAEASPPEAPAIELNKPFDGRVGGGKKQTVLVNLTADQFAAFHIASPNIKMGVTQIRPGGDRVGIFGFTNLTQDAKFGFVAETGGKYQLEVY